MVDATLAALASCFDVLRQEPVAWAITAFDLDLSRLCYASTSVGSFGAYDEADLVAFGYRRDHRPGCK